MNQYGLLLLAENLDDEGVASQMHMLDPIQVRLWSNFDIVFLNCMGNWLPQGKIPGFLDDRLYSARRLVTKDELEFEEILAPKIPLSLGGKYEAQNFQIENIFEFYESTGEIYRKQFEK